MRRRSGSVGGLGGEPPRSTRPGFRTHGRQARGHEHRDPTERPYSSSPPEGSRGHTGHPHETHRYG